MKPFVVNMCVLALSWGLPAMASAAPPATEQDVPAFPGSVVVSDDSQKMGPMTRLTRRYETTASADDVLAFYTAKLDAAAKKSYALAATLAPGETSGVSTLIGAVCRDADLRAASQEVRNGFAGRKKAAGADWVKSARLQWSSKDKSGSTRSFSLEIADRSVSDDDPSRYQQKTEIRLQATITAKAGTGTDDSLAGLMKLGQAANAQQQAAADATNKVLAQDLFAPAKSGTPPDITAALRAGGNVEERDLEGNTPLMESAGWNPDPEVTVTLLNAGAGVNDVSSLGTTALHFAASQNTAAVVLVLLKAGANVHAELSGLRGTTPLFEASGNTHPGVVSALVKAGADVHLRYEKLNESPLLAAVGSANAVAVQELLANGAGDETRGSDGTRLLLSAVSSRPDLTIMSALLKAGADVNGKAADMGGVTPLMSAALAEDVRVPTLLLDFGADVSATDQTGKTALMHAAEGGGNPAVISLLLARGADPKAKDVFGNTAALYARHNPKLQGADLSALNVAGAVNLIDIARNGTPEEVRDALKSGCDAGAIDSTGYEMTALMYAAQSNRDPEVITALLAGGARPDTRDKLGRTALMIGAQDSDNPGVISALLAGGAGLNFQDKMFAQTALMYAAANERTPEILGVLLKAGADPKIKDKAGKTARDYARNNRVFKGTAELRAIEQATK